MTGATRRAKQMMLGGLVAGHAAGFAVCGTAIAVGLREALIGAALGFAAVVIFFSVGQAVEVVVNWSLSRGWEWCSPAMQSGWWGSGLGSGLRWLIHNLARQSTGTGLLVQLSPRCLPGPLASWSWPRGSECLSMMPMTRDGTSVCYDEAQ